MYAAGEARPVEVFLDGKSLGKVCYDIPFGTAPFEVPVEFSGNSGILGIRELEFWGQSLHSD